MPPRNPRSLWIATVILCQASMSLVRADVGPISALTLDPVGATGAKLGYFPIRIQFLAAKPPGITKEPAYRAAPKYAILRLGNGPNSAYVIAVDEPADADFRIYVDRNRNGDLTDDGDGAWSAKKAAGGRVLYGPNHYVLRASWGTPEKESSSGDYGIALYRWADVDALLAAREGARFGTVNVDGKAHKAALVENDADALYDKALDDGLKPRGGGKPGNPVWLLVDLNDTGDLSAAEAIDARSPFALGSGKYEAAIAQDGSSLALRPTARKVPEKPAREEPPPVLASGTVAPDFKAEALGGGAVSLAPYRGRIVILDFWATWCGPCQRSMPHIERIYRAVKDQGVAVLGICVWDSKPAYEAWIPENRDKYTFAFGYDPAGRDNAASIASKLYNVSGIPTTYLIGADGRIAGAFVGFDGDGDRRIEDGLRGMGVKMP